MRLFGLLLFIIIFLEPLQLVVAEELPPASVQVEVDRSEITIGDQVHYTLKIDYAAGVEVEKPEWGEGLQGFQILDFERNEPQKVGDRWQMVDTYTLSTFTPEDYTIPPIRIPVKLPGGATQELTTAPIQIKVASILPENEEKLELKDIKAPGPVYSGILTGRIAAIVIGLLALISVIYGVLRWRKRRQQVSDVVEDIRPEHEIALEAIERLRLGLERSEGDPDQLICRQFGLDLSEIMRAYLEKRFGFSALEMTTEEIIHSLPSIHLLRNTLSESERKELQKNIGELLEDLDLLKFAKEIRTKENLSRLLDESVEIIHHTQREAGESNTESLENEATEREVA